MKERKRLTPAEVEAVMIPKLRDAIYPVLIPVEQQSVQIQAENHARITQIATDVWRSFVTQEQRHDT